MMKVQIAPVPLAIALAASAWTSVSGQSRLPRAPGAHVVTITPPGQTGSEPAIAVNPNNPQQVVGIGGGWAGYSTDGGRTFTAGQPAARSRPGRGEPPPPVD